MKKKSNSTPLAPDKLVSWLTSDLRGLLLEHPPWMFPTSQRGLPGANLTLRVNLAEQEIEADVSLHGNESETVSLTWDSHAHEIQSMITVDCTCMGRDPEELCEHTFATVRQVLLELTQPHSALLDCFLHPMSHAWKKILAPLDQYLRVTPSAGGTIPDISEEHSTRRLIYRFESVYQRFDLTPYEQTVLKNGDWSKGKRLSWSRLAEERPQELSDTDRAVRLLARKALGYQNTDESRFHSYATHIREPQIWDLLETLVGHSLVFADRDHRQPVEIATAQVELTLDPQTNGQLAIVPTITGHPLPKLQTMVVRSHGMICHHAAQNQLLIWEATAPQVDLVAQLVKQPTQIPRDAVAEVLPRLTQLEGTFKINYPEEMRGEIATGNAQTIVRLVPRAGDHGLAIEIWVRPADQGAYFEPGEGATSIAFWAQEQRNAVERDLPAERAAAMDCQRDLRLDRFKSLRPWKWTLGGGDEMLDFLTELQTYQSPPWVVEWSNSAIPRPDVVGEITPSSMQLKIDSDHDWFGVEGTIDIGGEQVPLMAVLDALRKNSKYVAINNGKWAKIAAEFRDRLSALADLLHRHHSKFNIDVTAAPLLEDLFKDQQITIRAAEEWQGALRKLEKARRHTPTLPDELKAELRDYQIDGYRWLSRLAAWGVGGCLADDMGLGKTVQALAILLERRTLGPTLVVAPVSVGFNWVNETQRFAPVLKPHLYRDTERGEFLSEVQPNDVVVTSYGLLLRDAEFFTAVKWSTLILDEAQFIKNSRTKSAQIVRDLQADWRLALTGTPVENQLSDLWSLFRATAPGLFGSWERFRERFADPIEKQKLPERQQALARTVRPFILRRTKEEVLKELPARTEMILTAELSQPERKLYEDARLLALTQLSGIDSGKNEARFQVLAMLTRLRQLACHPKLVDEDWSKSSAKLDLLLETLDEILEGGHRALIFSQFTSHLELIRKALDGKNLSYLYLDGQTAAKDRRTRVEAFQAGQHSLFLISLKAGGTGLNLTGADYVIHMDPWWNPAVEDQATDRAHRMGQTKPVMVYRLVAKNTIEEKILALHDKKRDLVAGIMAGSDQAAKLSTDELMDLIKSNQVDDSSAIKSPKRKPGKKATPRA